MRELIGARYGAAEQTIQNALRERVPTIEPSRMQTLLSTGAASVVTNPPSKSGKKRGPAKSRTEDTLWFEIGRKVEKKALAGNPSQSEEVRIIAARNAIAQETRYERDTVAQYHQRYRSWLKKHPQV